jgi:hypothetical protein
MYANIWQFMFEVVFVEASLISLCKFFSLVLQLHKSSKAITEVFWLNFVMNGEVEVVILCSLYQAKICKGRILKAWNF